MKGTVRINLPPNPPRVDEQFIKILFGVSTEQEFIEKLARGDYGDIWEDTEAKEVSNV